jgi:hypothetical protein
MDDNIKPMDKYKMDTRVGKIILVFFILVTIFWLLLYTFNPGVIQGPSSNRRYVVKGDPVAVLSNPGSLSADDFDAIPDTGRCFVGALILALVVVILLWLFRACY